MVMIACDMTEDEINAALEVVPPGALKAALQRGLRIAKAESAMTFERPLSDTETIHVSLGGVRIGTAKLYAYTTRGGIAYWQIYISKTGKRLRAPKWPELQRRIIQHLREEELLL